MTTKQYNAYTNKDALGKHGGLDSHVDKIINVNRKSMQNLLSMLDSMDQALSKSTVPGNIQPRSTEREQVGALIGRHFPIGQEFVKPYPYTHKPFGEEVLDFDPNTGEFVRLPINEWRSNTRFGIEGNTLADVTNFIPMGMELELVYRDGKIQCNDCYEQDYDNDEYHASFCDTDDCNDWNTETYETGRQAYRFLALLNISFGAYRKSDKAIWIPKYDSSVDIEFVSMPMTIRAWRTGLYIAQYKFNAFSQAATWGKGFFAACGGHIHIDKDLFTNTYQYYAFLAMHYDNPQFIASIAQRSIDSDSAWCYMAKPNNFAKVAKDKLNSTRRGAVNVTEHTVELRYFRSNLKVERLLKNVEVLQAMFDYTSKLTYQDLASNLHDLQLFLTYIKANRYQYSNLFNYLVLRRWIKNEKMITNWPSNLILDDYMSRFDAERYGYMSNYDYEQELERLN
jgi:hypothetical protein